MNSRSSHELDMLNGSVLPKLLVFAVPLAFSGILQLAFNAADVIVLGRYVGSEALAAVGSTGSLTSLLVNLFVGLSVGVNVVVATAYAAGKYDDVSKAVHTSVAFSIVCGILLIFAGYFLAQPMLTFMGSPDNVLPLSVKYMRIYFCGMPFIQLYNFGSAVLRSIGDTRRPLIYLTIAGVTNVILNLIFTIGFNMGVAGVALATTVSNMISSLLVLRALMKEESCLKVDLRKLNLDMKTIGKIARVGIPAGLQSVLFAVSNVLIQSSVNSFGSVVMAGNSASASLEGFWYTAMHSIYTGAITFVGQHIGARKYSRLNRIVGASFVCELLISAVFMSIFALAGSDLLRLYSTEPEVIAAAMRRLHIFILGYWICGFMDCGAGFMRGLGYGTLPMIVSLIGAVGLRIIWIYTVFAATRSYELLLWSYPISWLITFFAHMICYRWAAGRLPKEDGKPALLPEA